ncbi:NAD(P)/FAD-dependent oxidoreductase [Methylobacterium sp. J-076]|uniref:NAD(P)/FAD-dependent oxidoreductase n=1 Tax=Methylobacterium sp. J-076 TaxID=2836655 RepID=UPI001FBAFC0D|nr:FAD-dependent oxidoreductase [Methylobacterium sp. J-076]MCJ2012412.1 NAD(P)-binding protein [Methylobacterium sp. J-076]
MIAIVGAGMAGLACARALEDAGHRTALFDKGRKAGGRMSCREGTSPAGPVAFDHGAQYMTGRDPAFLAQLAAWRAAGLVAPWPAAGPEAWVGVPGMNAPLLALGRDLPVRWGTRVEALVREEAGWRLTGEGLDEGGFRAVLTAIPAEQTATLLRDCAPDFAGIAGRTPSAPCWTAMAAFPARLPIGGDVLRTEGAVAWAARNSAKPDRPATEAWVIQASPGWSRTHLEREAPPVADALLAEFFAAAGIAATAPSALTAHRWRYAKSGAAERATMWDPERGIGACGDWLTGPRVENAWLSGRRLAEAVAGSVG